MIETKAHEYRIQGDERAVFYALVDAIQQLKQKEPNVEFRGIKVSVNPTVFGVDEAFSIRIKLNVGEGEIGRITVKPIRGNKNLLTIPKNRTGGSAPPDLDSDGLYFKLLEQQLLKSLKELGVVTSEKKEKRQPRLQYYR